MVRKYVIAAFSALLLLCACSHSQGPGGGETSNTAVGPAASGQAGSQIGKSGSDTSATLTGVLLGGKSDDGDRAAAARAEQRAYTAPLGQQVTWSNPNNGDKGTITPARDGYIASGAYCREFQQTIVIGGQQQQAYGKACQQMDGSWKIVQ